MPKKELLILSGLGMERGSEELPSRDELSVVIQDRRFYQKGVFYVETNGKCDLFLNGDCPNLNSGKCGVYEERPGACRNLEPGSKECFQIRKRGGLEPDTISRAKEILIELLSNTSASADSSKTHF